MASDHDSLNIGPVHCAWRPHHPGTAAETLVRPWLAAQLNVPEAALALPRDAHGRPRLAPLLTVHGRPQPSSAGHDVSWSHSGALLLMALAAGLRLGVDLERLRPRPRALELARRFFTAEESAQLAALPADAREHAFVRLWCAKEAVLKAHGRGIAFGLHRLAFAFDDGAWTLFACDPALGTPGDWTLHSFAPQTGYLATLAWRPA